jgi:hypothetical protein
MKVLLFAAGQHDAEIIIKNSVFIHVDPRHDDSNPSALFCGVRSMSIQLHPARLASGSDLSRELSRLDQNIEIQLGVEASRIIISFFCEYLLKNGCLATLSVLKVSHFGTQENGREMGGNEQFWADLGGKWVENDENRRFLSKKGRFWC